LYFVQGRLYRDKKVVGVFITVWYLLPVEDFKNVKHFTKDRISSGNGIKVVLIIVVKRELPIGIWFVYGFDC
jgi:hypothetical protein